MISRIRISLIAVAVVLMGTGTAAMGATGDDLRMQALSRSSDSVEFRLASLEREYGHRRGLIGAQAAEMRFEEAVFAYLIEEYEKAAITFYTLVEAEALVRSGLARDAEWYLAECLYEAENYLTAAEAYQRIIDQGRKHPFFTEAVRRQLETYGYLKDTPSFYRVYNRYIVTAIVPTTDSVRYSMGKSFYHQGDGARAKVLFAEVSPSSRWYTRARYFLGAIQVDEGQLEAAVKAFEAVAQHMPPDQAAGYQGYGGIQEFARLRAVETEVQELARLALGRIRYEQGRFDEAQVYYQDIRAESAFFTEQLYELVWTYVKQEKWLDAINQIEIFLIAFPEHHYAFRLQLLLGHLHMRRQAFERALSSYENVVETFAPIQDHLLSIQGSQDQPDLFFAAIVEADALQDVDPLLPAFTIDLLVEDGQIGRAVEVRRSLASQGTDLEDSRNLIDQIAPVLHKGTEGIGTFRQGRNSIATVRNDGLKLRADVIEFNLIRLEEYASPAQKPSLVDLRERWEVLVGRVGHVRSVETDETDRVQAYVSQIREVQQAAFRAQQVALDQAAQVTALKRRLREGTGGLSASEAQEVREQISEVERGLKETVTSLERMQGDAVRRRVMGSVDTGVEVDTSAQRGLIADDLNDLHADVVAFRGRVSVPAASGNHAAIDKMWDVARAVERRSLSTLAKLERAEANELSVMRRRLAEEMDLLVTLGSDLGSTTERASAVSGAVTRAGIGRIGNAFSDTVMGADRGILDVYWAKKAGVSDEIERLNEERSLRVQELDERFEMVRQRLGEAEQGGD